MSSGGDIKIKVNRPDGIISERHPQDWSISIEVNGGGLIEISDKEWGVTYFAPSEGYKPSGVFSKNSGVGSFDKTFFVKSRNGQIYSKLGFSFSINDTPDGFMYVRLGGVANTNSSRNWEATAPQQ